MSHRAGPPTPRPAEPWQSPSKVLTFGGADDGGAYEARSKAWKSYLERMQMYWTPLMASNEKDGFFAGWQACAEFNAASKKAVDKTVEPVSSLFPTDAEIEGTSK